MELRLYIADSPRRDAREAGHNDAECAICHRRRFISQHATAKSRRFSCCIGLYRRIAPPRRWTSYHEARD